MRTDHRFIKNLAISAATVVASESVISQTVDQSVQAHQVNGDAVVEWYAHAGRTYFLQATTDLGPIQSWMWMDIIEVGDDRPISHEFGSTAPRAFVRLHYIDEVPPPGVSPEDWDADGDGLTNWQELVDYQTHPLDEDTDHDGTLDGLEAAGASDPKDPGSGGTPVVGKIESDWIWITAEDDFYMNGGHAVFYKEFEWDDSDEGNWTFMQNQFQDAVDAESQEDLAVVAGTFPLPNLWEEEIKGLWWRNVEEMRGPQADEGPFQDWSAGRLKHRMRLNRKAPPLGYEYPFQVLKLNWTRAAAEGSPWLPDAGNSSIIQKFEIEPGEVLSEPLEYDPILGTGLNKAVTLHAIRFEEVEPESGFDDHVRYDPTIRFDIPWLVVANSETPTTPPNAKVKIHFSPAEPSLKFEVDVDGGHSATVTPDTISGDQPVTLTIEGSNDFGTDENAYSGSLKIEGVTVLNLVFYKRREIKLAVHEITKTNDDVNAEYPESLGGPMIPIEIGNGKPNVVCITKGPNGSLDSQKHPDDGYIPGLGITTGSDGIRQTEISGDDGWTIEIGNGEPDAVIVMAGINGVLNTAPNDIGSNVPHPETGVIMNPQDDEIDGLTITTGADGIRQTPEIEAAVAPVNVPSQAQLQDQLDSTYGMQVNIWFDIVEWNQGKEAAYDVGSTSGADANYPVMAKSNRHFDFYVTERDAQNKPVLSLEETIVRSASYNSNSDTINLYFLGSGIQSNFFLIGDRLKSNPLGQARSEIRCPYFSAFNPVFDAASADQTSTFKMLYGAAHELGHNDLFDVIDASGLAHPWDDKGEEQTGPPVENDLVPYHPSENFTLLDQQWDRRRLMWFKTPRAPHPVTGRPPTMLLKDESDTLHELVAPAP